jgi:hypothetical protein
LCKEEEIDDDDDDDDDKTKGPTITNTAATKTKKERSDVQSFVVVQNRCEWSTKRMRPNRSTRSDDERYHRESMIFMGTGCPVPKQ